MKRKLILFFLQFGFKAILSACPNVNFGFNTAGSNFQVIIFEDGTFDDIFSGQIESISKSEVESELLFLIQGFFSEMFLIQE